MDKKNKKINIDLKIVVKNIWENLDIFLKNYKLYIKKDFLSISKEKSHNLENHIKNFKEKIKINQQQENTYRYQKYEIYYVNFWINIWNEINWIRPSLIIKSNRHNWWYDILVIPMTWFYNKNWTKKILDTFDVIVKTDLNNKLKKDSVLKVRHLKSISKKRIWNKIWKLNNIFVNENLKFYDEIDNKIKQMIWIK